MFTKKMLKKLMYNTPRNLTYYVVVGTIAFEIKGAVCSVDLNPDGDRPKLWLVAGNPADHQPPLDVHQPSLWLNRKHNRRPS